MMKILVDYNICLILNNTFIKYYFWIFSKILYLYNLENFVNTIGFLYRKR